MSVAFGLVLYVVNFQILGRLFFKWFQEGAQPDIRSLRARFYGLALAPFLVGYAKPAESAARGRVAAAAR